MIVAIDTSSFVAYLSGNSGFDVEIIDKILDEHRAVVPSVVLSEILSDHRLPKEIIKSLRNIPLLDIGTGFWERAGKLRAKILSAGHKARLADALIAQNCIDHNVSLVTRDKDFRHFVRIAGLKILS
ncbi:MAG: PIN domain-containing protein [bacterium]|nr:PIN domain-containing protein [bacterium]